MIYNIKVSVKVTLRHLITNTCGILLNIYQCSHGVIFTKDQVELGPLTLQHISVVWNPNVMNYDVVDHCLQ